MLIASFAGIVVGILSSAVTVEKLDDLTWYAALPLLIGVGCLLLSIVGSLVAVIPHAVYGGLTQLGREWTNRQRFLEAAQVLRRGDDLPEADYRELVFRQTHPSAPTPELVLRVRLRQLLNFKEATTFRQIFTTLSAYLLIAAFASLILFRAAEYASPRPGKPAPIAATTRITAATTPTTMATPARAIPTATGSTPTRR